VFANYENDVFILEKNEKKWTKHNEMKQREPATHRTRDNGAIRNNCSIQTHFHKNAKKDRRATACRAKLFVTKSLFC